MISNMFETESFEEFFSVKSYIHEKKMPEVRSITIDLACASEQSVVDYLLSIGNVSAILSSQHSKWKRTLDRLHIHSRSKQCLD